MVKLRIMSNNIWYNDSNNAAWEAQGANCSAKSRAPGLNRVYAETQPDIIGLQECSPLMANLIMEGFLKRQAPYALLWGKDTPIIYRSDKFELLDSENFIFSEEVPGIEGSFNNDKTKSYTIALFKLKENGKRIIFATTHLWWKSSDPENKDYQPHSDEARKYQLNLLIDRLEAFKAKYNCPVIFVGDLNAIYSSPALSSARERGYIHSHDIATDYADETFGLHYCYPDRYDTIPYEGGFEKSIDHIFVKDIKKDAVKHFERISPEYYMASSDHFPVWIDIEM